ncbi:MAG: hypothetical protein DRJ45_08590 [Thermoprotei archaeon]|nr:MAG: hypothetical protein DRJ45_08590 [Thermoprotei archaeon]
MDFSIKVLQKGRITIPIKIRRMFGIKEGDILTLKVVGGRIIILPPRTIVNLTETLDGLLEDIVIETSIKEELKKSSSRRIERKISRSKLSSYAG